MVPQSVQEPEPLNFSQASDRVSVQKPRISGGVKKIIAAASILIISALLIGAFFIFTNKQNHNYGQSNYTSAWRLVDEKISRSANIRINLPAGTDKELAKQKTVFDPPISGKWAVEESSAFNFIASVYGAGEEQGETIVFDPDEPLNLNRHYSLAVNLGGDKILQAEFLAVEDLKILSIFPENNSEALEDSKITIIFNRPMVPLTTLEALDSRQDAVKIFPNIEGKFRWISTNALQFSPKDKLQSSTRYTVKVGNINSMDGLKADGMESSFTIRNLRYSNSKDENNSELVYNRPVSIYFNQPVDLEKTIKEIKLVETDGSKGIPFEAQYKKIEDQSAAESAFNDDFWRVGGGLSLSQRIKIAFNFIKNKLLASASTVLDLGQGNVDKSVIEIYAKADQSGRSRVWDLEKNYRLTISKAFPEKGDVDLEQVKNIDFRTTNIIASLKAEGRTDYASQSFFDPDGKLIVSFYEPIEITKSSISSPVGINKIEYDQMCDWSDSSSTDSTCRKVDNKQAIKISFDKNRISAGQEFDVSFSQIVNEQGKKINAGEIIKKISVYDPFSFRLASSTIGSLVLCSNNPISAPEKKDFKTSIKADLDYDIFNWGSSWKQDPNRGGVCNDGEFETTITAGFIPDKNYNFDFNISDVFGQEGHLSAQAATGPMESEYVDIFPMQNDYSVTTPANRTLTFGAKNLAYVNVEICKIDSYHFSRISGYNYNYQSSGEGEFKKDCQSLKQAKIDLPEKYWVNNYFDIDPGDYFSDPKGNYVITLTNPLWESGYNKTQNREVSLLSVTDLAVAEKRIDPLESVDSRYESDRVILTDQQKNGLKNMYWVTDIASQDPIEGAKVKIYLKGNVVGEATTDSQGLAFLEPVAGAEAATVDFGQDSVAVTRSGNSLNYASSASNVKKFYIYTDRPLYRPTNAVNAKGILRLGYDGNYQLLDQKEAEVTIRNSRSEEVLARKVVLSDFGTFNFDFTLDQNAPLGTWSICVKNSYGCAYFDVLEYVPAAFQVNLKTDKDEYISKDNVKVDIDASYYFGAPVENGKVEYTVSSQNYYFDKYKEGYFRFGYYDWYKDYGYEDDGSYHYGDKFISRGELSLDASGKGSISENIDLQKILDDDKTSSKIIVFDVTVKNSLGQSISSQKSLIVHAGQFYLGVDTDPYAVKKDQEFNLKIKSVDTEGKNLKVNNITAEIYKVGWVYSRRQEVAGSYNYVWEEKRDLAKRINFGTNDSGDYSAALKLSEEGEYEIDVSAKDRAGNNVFSQGYVYVYGSGAVNVRSDGTDLVLKPNKQDLKANEEGEVIIESPYPKGKALITLERGKIFDYKIVDVVGNLFSYKFTALEDYAPNIFVSVLLQSSDPAVKFGSQEFTIASDKNKIAIDVSSDKKFYSPGEEVTLKINAKDYKNDPVQSEISVAVADLSVLALKGNPKKDPLVFFYDGFPLTVSTFSNIKPALVKYEKSEEATKGGGGSEMTTKARGEFKDTAFWKGDAVTDSNGYAELRFKLPDNLTTWQTEVLGTTKDTKLGVSYMEFTTKKELMAVPLEPRFILPGDTFLIGAQIFNQSSQDQQVNVSFKSDTLQFLDSSKEIGASIKKGESKILYFKVKAPENIGKGSHDFVISAKAGDLEDTVVQSIAINSNTTYEASATAGYTMSSGATETIYLPQNISQDQGGLTIKSSATLAVFLSDALNYFIDYPYGCSEQVSSRLKAIAIVKAGLNIPNVGDKLKLNKVNYNGKEYSLDEMVPVGLAKIYNNQDSSGGFGLWSAGYPDYYTTLKVVDTLNYLKKAGFSVDENALNRGADYLYSKLQDTNIIKDSPDQMISAASVLLSVEKYKGNRNIGSALEKIANDDIILKDKLSNLSLGGLAVIFNSLQFNPMLASKVNQLIDNRINIDSRGAFLEANQNHFYHYYETSIADTALYMKSFAVGRRNVAFNDKIVRWLLSSRDSQGAWGSTQNTLAVIDAFTEYLKWKKETSADYILQANLNGKELEKFSFNKETILDQLKKEIPTGEFKLGEYNSVTLGKSDKDPSNPGSLYYDLSLKYYVKGEVAPRDEGFTVTRNFYAQDDNDNKNPLAKAVAGQVFREHIEIIVAQERRNVVLEDYIPAGLEIVDLSLATEQQSLRFNDPNVKNRIFYPDYKELRDDRAFAYREILAPGVYEFDYYVRALVKGSYLQLPAVASEMYFPENFGRTASNYFEVD